QGATGRVRLLWDDNFMYALFEVKDSVLNKSSQNAYEQDSVEIFLDQNNEKSDFYDNNDGQYRVNFEGENSFGTVPTQQGFQSAAKKTDTGYIVELAIPLLSKAQEGAIMGFDAQINDSNSSGVRQGIAKFNDVTDNSWSSTKLWGNLELVK
ncbi:MAG TPA: sugar-binding protein, partial [Mobilitalea sp.]|nr:sugar-binding protein [Mobilitalea sp.]